jgi:CBS domain-containing protein
MMEIKEVMSRQVKVASPEDNLQWAAQLMEKDDFGFLPVGENDRLVGTVTDRDIVIRGVAQGKAPADCKVREVMTKDPKFVFEDEQVEDAARNMSSLKLRRLPVVNRDKRLVGVVSLGDLAARRPDQAGQALGSISRSPA